MNPRIAIITLTVFGALLGASCANMARTQPVEPTPATTRTLDARPVTLADLDATWARCRAALDALYDAKRDAPLALIEATRDVDDMRLRLRGERDDKGVAPVEIVNRPEVQGVLNRAATALAELPK